MDSSTGCRLANGLAYLQAGGHHIKDTIYWKPGLPIPPHPRPSTGIKFNQCASPRTKGAATFQQLEVCRVSIFPSCPYFAGGLRERRKFPHRGLGAEPWPQTILGHFMCNLMRLYTSFSAFDSCLEMGDCYIPLLAIVA